MYSRRNVFAGLGVSCLVAPAAEIAAAAAGVGQVGRKRQRMPDVELQTHTGAAVRFHSDLIRGRVVAINMMYTQCEGICPMMTANLVRVQSLLKERIGKDIFMYSVTLRPEEDSPETLAEYAKAHGVRPGWTFLTGKPANIEAVRYALGFYDRDPTRDKQADRHTSVVRIGNDTFDRWSMAPALADPAQIVSSILHVVRSEPAA